MQPNNGNKATNSKEVIVYNQLTVKNEFFLIFDNQETNRILVFASKRGLYMLSESLFWNADGTFHTASR
jgi:hypothetical protein